MAIEENRRSLANVEARVADEKQNHRYNEDESKGHIQGEYVHQGEDVKRTEKAGTAATAGRSHHQRQRRTGHCERTKRPRRSQA